MIARLLPRPTPARAAAILRSVFGRVRTPVAFRLWEGTEVSLSADKAETTVVIKSPEIFLGLLGNPTPYGFAEAYVSGAIDLEGSLFAAMPVANEVEYLRIPRLTKLRLLLSLWRA